MTKCRIVVASGAVALIAAACGSGGNQGSGGTPSQGANGTSVATSAYQATRAAKTAKVNLQAQVSGAPAASSGPSSISGDGVIGFNSDSAQLAVKVPSGGTLTIRLLGQVLYLMVPPQAGHPVTPKPWIKIDLNKAAQSNLGASFSSLSPSGSVNPANLLGYLRGVTTLTKVGPEPIRGVQTTHYQGTVDLNKLASNLNGKTQTAYRQLVAKLQTTTVPIELWVDAQGRARQIRTTVPEGAPATTTTAPAAAAPTTAAPGATGPGATAPATTAHGTTTAPTTTAPTTTAPTTTAPTTTAPGKSAMVSTTVDYYDFGGPVQVSAPPANQVTVLPQSSAGG